MWCLWVALMAVLMPFLIAEKVVRPHRRDDDE